MNKKKTYLGGNCITCEKYTMMKRSKHGVVCTKCGTVQPKKK